MTPEIWCELLVGLERVEVLDVVRRADRLFVTVESIDRLMGCGACGTRATVKDWDRVELADLPAFGCPVTLVWLKRRWRCGEADCGEGTWTEDRPDIAPARSTMTPPSRRVGHHPGRSPRALGVVGGQGAGRHLAHRHGRRHPLGRDPCQRPRPGRRHRSHRGGRDVVPGRHRHRGDPLGLEHLRCRGPQRDRRHRGPPGPDLDRWLSDQLEEWKSGVSITVCDLHEPFRAALARHLPDATAVADPFHVVAVGTRCVDATRRRVQNDTLGHRGG